MPQYGCFLIFLQIYLATVLEAQETVRAIKQAIDKTDQPDTWTRLLIGDDDIGFVTYENVAKNQRWTTLRVSNPTFVSRAKKLAQGELHLPQRAQPIAIPITPARHVAQVGPVDRDINGRDNSPFSKRAGYAETDEYPNAVEPPTEREGNPTKQDARGSR